MKILNYIFLDDYFKLDFESESGFKIVIGYKSFYFFLKATAHTHLFIKAKKTLSKVVVFHFNWFKLKKASFKLEPENLIQNDFPSIDLTYNNSVNTQGIENRTGDLLNYTDDFKEIKFKTPFLKFKPPSNPSRSINYELKNKYIKKIIKYKRPILRIK